MNLEKVKSITNRIMDVNRKLADLGETKIPINFIGMAGVGKTSSLMQVAEERGCHIETVVLSQLEEVGDEL